MTYRKKLIEVALPLETINRESAREKSIRYGHPSTLHLWWARRPLATCRAVLFASLVDDPSAWPELFEGEDAQEAERMRLFEIIEELVMWDNSNNDEVLLRAQTEIAHSIARNRGEEMPQGAKAIRKYIEEYAPPVLDPFCGGGSIPLEAQRLGLRAHGNDLNPVAVLITKALIEIPPKFAGLQPVNPEAREDRQLIKKEWRGAEGLAEDVRYYGKWMRDEAEKRIGHLYPKVEVTKEMAKDHPELKPYVGQGLTVIAWLWARTVQCPNPGCRARTPLVRSFWVSKKKGKNVFMQPVLDEASRKVLHFIPETDGEPIEHTTDRTGARCLFCDIFIKKPQLREIAMKDGIDPIPFSVVAEGDRGRVYLSSDVFDHVEITRPNVPFLEQPIADDKRWFSPPLYGMKNFADLFTDRQLVALNTFSDLVVEARVKALADAKSSGILHEDADPFDAGGTGPTAYADAVATYLSFGPSKGSNLWSTICSWMNDRGALRETFARQALPMVWDFAEANPFSDSGGNISMFVDRIADALMFTPASIKGISRQLDATSSIESLRQPIISTDPPYYDNIGYSDLSDYFYIWLRRSLGEIYPSLFSTLLTPKTQELIASSFRHGSRGRAQAFFEKGLGNVFERMHEAGNREFPVTIYYAFKQAESEEAGAADVRVASTGWETMLSGLIQAGFSIHGTWPMRTESPGRAVARGTNALASSIVLVCRPRLENAPMATRREFINALKGELPDALIKLQHGNIAPVDLAQASIGPGMAVFTRYSKVMEADGSPMSVRTALTIINQSLDEVLAEQEGEFDSDTRWAVAWFEQQGMQDGPYGVAETLSKAKDTAVAGMVEAGILLAVGGKVRLLSLEELIEGWDPATDKRFTTWEATHHLIRALEREGEEGAAALLRKLGGVGEQARDLAYRLYSICERKKWAKEAQGYNNLVIAWPELTRLAQSTPSRGGEQISFEQG